MINRIIIPILLGTILPYLWIDLHVCHGLNGWKRALLWFPAILELVYSAYMAVQPGFVPDNPVWVDVWFAVMALCAVPQFVFAFFSALGWCCERYLHVRKGYGNQVGAVVAVIAFGMFIYGFTFGFRKLEVKHVTVVLPDLPDSFDGYKIVQFSDFHLGSFYGWRKDIPQRDVDSIQAQHADMICFTGDLQNAQPSELNKYKTLLSSLRAKDGVFSILGNHDYSYYVDGTPQEKEKIERDVQRFERSLGWRLLNNEHVVVSRGADSLYLAGTENYDKPKRTSVAKALYGIKPGNFVLMLQHIPTQWKKMTPSTINEEYGSKDSVLVAPQLTLSGHTHAGQVEVLGLRPTMFAAYDYGLYEREGCQLYTTAGLGGVVPIRIGATAEIVVITLRKK